MTAMIRRLLGVILLIGAAGIIARCLPENRA